MKKRGKGVREMYKTQCSGQQRIEGFRIPFGGKLCEKNRWVRLAQIMPWELIERRYAESFSEEKSDIRFQRELHLVQYISRNRKSCGIEARSHTSVRIRMRSIF